MHDSGLLQSYHFMKQAIISPSCYIVSLINIDNWPCLRINIFQQMNQTRSLAETSTLHDLRALQVLIMLIDQLEKYVSET